MPTRCWRRRAALQKELRREMRARLKEDDSEPPQVDGPWAYYSRFRHGGQHRIYCRKPARGRRGDGADRRRRARRGQGAFFISPPRAIRPTIRSSPGAPTISAPRLLTIAVRDLDAARRTSPIASTGRPAMSAWTARFRRRFSMSSRTRAIARGASCCIGSGRAQSRRRRDLRRKPTRPGSSASSDATWPRGHHLGPRPRRLGERMSSISTIRPRRRDSSRRAGRASATRSWTTATSSTSAPTRGAPDFKIVVAPRDAPQEANWRDVRR